jgi:hypothetical protein
VLKSGLNLIMNPCPLEELQAMFGPTSKDAANFSYTVFGGSARMGNLLNDSVLSADEALEKAVHDELTEYLADSVYATCTDLIKGASLLIANKMEAASGQRAARALEHSLFRHTYFTPTPSDSRGKGTHATCFATTFMNILAGVLVTRSELCISQHLRDILGGGGMGVVYEAQVHKTLYEKFRKGGDLILRRLYPKGAQRKVTETDAETLRVIVDRKVFIRKIEEIALLKENEYGLPIIPNFSLVDAVIKVCTPGNPPCGVELQVTIADSHKGALHKHPDIELHMGIPSALNKMIFCCCTNNFENFRYVAGLVAEVPQYKTLCEWMASAGNPAKKRKGESESESESETWE